MAPSRPLGVLQAEVLDALRSHGYWTTHCGHPGVRRGGPFVYSSDATTKRVLDGLVLRGLVTLEDDGRVRTYKPVAA